MFLLLVLTLLLFALTDTAVGRILVFVLQVTMLLFTLATSGVGARGLRLAVLGAIVLVMVALLVPLSAIDIVTAYALLWGLLLAPAIAAVLKRLFQHRVVTSQTVLGAVSAYLLLGLFTAYVYVLIAGMTDQPFFTSGPAESVFDFLYFSFVTLTTLGYGDFTSALDIGRGVAMTEAVIGQIFLVTAVARLVSLSTGRLGRPAPEEGTEEG